MCPDWTGNRSIVIVTSLWRMSVKTIRCTNSAVSRTLPRRSRTRSRIRHAYDAEVPAPTLDEVVQRPQRRPEAKLDLGRGVRVEEVSYGGHIDRFDGARADPLPRRLLPRCEGGA